jgi:5-methylthioadenosine/S-adenosylhomocysteine deaminase
MSDLLIRGGNLLASADCESLEVADVLIRDGVIAAVGSDLDASDADVLDVLDVTGKLVIPGLINAHLHSPGNLMRGTLDGMPLEVFMLYEVPQTDGDTEDPTLVRLRTLMGAAEMLKLGITSVADDAFFVPLASTEAIDALCGAYAESGMRATVGLDQPIVVEYDKFPFLADLLPAHLKDRMDALPRETAAGMLAHYDHLLAHWHGAAEGRIGAAVSCSAPQDYLAALSALSKTHDLPFFCHILETKLQRVLGEEKYGRSLVRYADGLGILDERMQVIHAIWVDEDDIAILARRGVTVAHNPVCNMRLGSGVMPFRALRDAGVPLCLGTDEAVSDDSHNLWGAIKAAGIVHALSDPDFDRWPKAPEILSAVWEGGNRMMRRPVPLGRIAPGYAGDLAILDLDTPAYWPLHDIRRQLVLNESGSSVCHTVVGGRVVVRDRKLTTIDEVALLSDIRAMEPGLRAQAAALRQSAADVEPYYRQMVRMAAARDVGFSRWIGR